MTIYSKVQKKKTHGHIRLYSGISNTAPLTGGSCELKRRSREFGANSNVMRLPPHTWDEAQVCLHTQNKASVPFVRLEGKKGDLIQQLSWMIRGWGG